MLIVLRRLPHLHPRRLRRPRGSARHPPRSSWFWPRSAFRRPRARDLAVTVDGELPLGVTAKDVVLGVYRPDRDLVRQGHHGRIPRFDDPRLEHGRRMTICNMSIEWGAKAGMVAPDDNHIHLPGATSSCPARRRVDEAPRALAVAGVGRRRTPSITRSASTRPSSSRIVTCGHQPRPGGAGHRARPRAAVRH